MIVRRMRRENQTRHGQWCRDTRMTLERLAKLSSTKPAQRLTAPDGVFLREDGRVFTGNGCFQYDGRADPAPARTPLDPVFQPAPSLLTSASLLDGQGKDPNIR